MHNIHVNHNHIESLSKVTYMYSICMIVLPGPGFLGLVVGFPALTELLGVDPVLSYREPAVCTCVLDFAFHGEVVRLVNGALPFLVGAAYRGEVLLAGCCGPVLLVTALVLLVTAAAGLQLGGGRVDLLSQGE